MSIKNKLKILAINPGSTSTKIALYQESKEIFSDNLEHAEDEIKKFETIAEQQAYRSEKILNYLKEKNIELKQLAAIVGRGGLLKPLASGTYRVDQKLLTDLKEAKRGEHASNLGGVIAFSLAQELNLPAFIVDPVAVDELEPIARFSGFAPVERTSLSHALNMKAVAKRFAAETERTYQDLRLVVAHLGSGISISAHRQGKMVDLANPREEGPFSSERCGSLPVLGLVKYVLENKLTFKEVDKMLFREGGLYSYLQTKDLRQVRQRIAEGDQLAAQVLKAMIYQICKEIGAMATVLEGKLEAILLTGGMTFDQQLVTDIKQRISFLTAKIEVYPGEGELQALAEGALRVLQGQEKALQY